MLTADLVQARVYKKKVRPRYVKDRDPELIDLAAQLIDTFDAYVGRSRQELDDELVEILGADIDVLLHRALAKLLFDRCSFETATPIAPDVLRQTLFRSAADLYRADSAATEDFAFDRDTALTNAARQLDLSAEVLERGLYADLKSEQVLVDWQRCEPDWLLRRYNTALAQGVLLRATELRLEIGPAAPEKHRALFRQIKFFQLMHRVARRPSVDGEPGGWSVVLDGPASLFKASGKYGVRMASFLPTLLHFESWSLEADVRWGPRRRACVFELDSARGLRPHGRLTGQWQPAEIAAFPERFSGLGSPWSVSTDGELVDLGGEGVLVPDLVFEHTTGVRVVMEIFGFWRKGAIDSRLRLLRRHGPERLVLAVSSQLATGREALDEVPGEVYIFRTQPVPRKVLKVLDRFL